MPIQVIFHQPKGTTAVQASTRRGSTSSIIQASVKISRPTLNRNASSNYLSNDGNRTQLGSATSSLYSSRRPSTASNSSGFSSDSGDWVDGSSTASSANSSRKSSIASGFSSSRRPIAGEAMYDRLTRTPSIANNGPNNRKPSIASSLSSDSTFSDYSFTASSDGTSRRSSMADGRAADSSPKTRTFPGSQGPPPTGRTPSVMSTTYSRKPGLRSRTTGSSIGSQRQASMSDYSDCNRMPLAFSGGYLSAKQRQDSQMARLSRPKHVTSTHVPSGGRLLNTGKNMSVGEMRDALCCVEQDINIRRASKGDEPIEWPPLRLDPRYSFATNALWKDHGQLLKTAVDKKVLAVIQRRWPEMYSKLF